MPWARDKKIPIRYILRIRVLNCFTANILLLPAGH
jgi:hypothetical protein